MKTIRNIILVVLFGIIIMLCLYIAPNFKKTGSEGKTNLVINYKNVTEKMKGRVIKEESQIYLSVDDIKNYYDKYIYYDEQYNYIIAAGNGYLACFDINNNTLNLNNKNSNVKIIKENDQYYIPITSLQELYNIKVDYNQDTNIVVIDSLDRELKSSNTLKKVSVKSKPTIASSTLEELDNDATVYVRNNEDEQIQSNQVKSKSILTNINNKIKSLEVENSKNWTYIRTENGTLGYIKNSDLSEQKIVRSEKKEENKTISLAWDYYDETYGSAPKNDANTKYTGINVVSPAFFYMKGNKVKENVGENGRKYIEWAKSNNYEVWARVANNNLSTDDMKSFSSWINDYEKRADVINQIVNLAKKYDLDGINLDFENMYKGDKDKLSRFIIELKPRIEQLNMDLSVDVTEPDGSDSWSLCYDRNVIGDVSDYIVFMAYDQHSQKSKKAGSVASFDWVERNINKFINNEKVNPNKIILGIPFYTRLWKINSNGDVEVKKTANIAIKDESKYIEKATTKEWLSDSQQYYIEYSDNTGNTYKMWVEDKDSIKQKLSLIKKYNLAGAAFWQKGNETKEILDLIEEQLLK